LRSIAAYLPAIACGVMMLLICVPMLVGRKRNQTNNQSASQEEVAELREEIARLKAQRTLEKESESLDG
jgi:hypothetical protein